MSTTKSRRRRLLLLLGAFLLLAGGATATTLALRPHGRPVAAPKRVTTTTVKEKSYPAVALPLPPDVHDGVYPLSLAPSCSPNGSTCLAGELNVRTGTTHLLLSDDGGKTWVPGVVPARHVPVGSYRQWSSADGACVHGACLVVTTANPGVSAVWRCAVAAGQVVCQRHPVPTQAFGLACVGERSCVLLGLARNPAPGPPPLELLAVSPSGQVGGVVGRPAASAVGGCQGVVERARSQCRNLTQESVGGVLDELRCNPSGCAASEGQSEILWRQPSLADPATPHVAVVRDETLGGARSPVPVTARVSGPTTTRQGVCGETTWCVRKVAALRSGGFAWSLSSPGGSGNAIASGIARPARLHTAWVVLSPAGQWSVTAHRPPHAGTVQSSGAVGTWDRWCGPDFCVRFDFSSASGTAVQRVPVRAAGTKDERAK